MRRVPSQDRARRTFGTVLAAAVRLIESEGLERATTRRIATAANLSVGAVYEYFPNKESIVLYLGTTWLSRIREAIEELHPARSGIADLHDYLNRMLAAIEPLYSDQPGLIAVVRLLAAIPELREADRAHDAAVMASIKSALQHYLPHADAAELDAVVSCIVAMGHGILSECLVVKSGDAARMVRLLHVSIYAITMPLMLPPRAPLPRGRARGR
jgi:AcrR family transcriptional regulator